MKLVIIAFILSTSLPSFILAEELYRAPDCGGYKNPATEISQALRQKIQSAFPNRATASGSIINIGMANALSDMVRHRENQCIKRNAGKKFDAECPIGKSIIVDDYVEAAFSDHGQKDNAALQNTIQQLQKDGRPRAKAMLETCNDR